ncbi:MAG: RES family NAD+ phosphorylase [Thermomicrobiales bacterium]|nr:RES family NAD+ phosphorylase [Thermomicrobiales bacterium]
MAVEYAADPPLLYRIGRSPDPLEFPPLSVLGKGRYDDPLGRTPTLYAAAERIGAFMESLDQFRFDLAALAARNEVVAGGDHGIDRLEGVIPPSYFRRRICTFSVHPNQRWLDVRSPAIHAHLRSELATQLRLMGIGGRFVLGDLLSNDHRVTQLIGRWAIDHGIKGIAYASCHDTSKTCWALFDSARIIRLSQPATLSQTDPDLQEVAKLWHLAIPSTDHAVHDEPVD